MGKPLPAGFGASGAPPAGDVANAVVSGTIAAVGPTLPFEFYGAFNVAIWGSVNISLTTVAGSNHASVTTGTGLVAGQTIISSLVPQGATLPNSTFNLGGLTTFQIAGLTTAQIAAIPAGADAGALFEPSVPEATVRLERSFDGGVTWVTCGIGGGYPAIFVLGAASLTSPVSVVAAEPERQVAYRLNCTAYTSGTINYRMSASGAAAMSWAVNVG